MTGHHHAGRCRGCGCCSCCCGRCDVDPDLWALGELVLAPLIALGTLAAWAARRPLIVLILAAGGAVALAVTAVAR